MKKKFLPSLSARGQSLVEFAISLVILLYLLSGAAEFAIALFQYVQLRDAAQEGALYGSIDPKNTAAIIARARQSSNRPINLQNAGLVTVEVFVDNSATPADDNIASTAANYNTYACEGHGIKVVVSYDHRVFMPFMSRIIGEEIELSATVMDTILTPPPTPAGTCP